MSGSNSSSERSASDIIITTDTTPVEKGIDSIKTTIPRAMAIIDEKGFKIDVLDQADVIHMILFIPKEEMHFFKHASTPVQISIDFDSFGQGLKGMVGNTFTLTFNKGEDNIRLSSTDEHGEEAECVIALGDDDEEDMEDEEEEEWQTECSITGQVIKSIFSTGKNMGSTAHVSMTPDGPSFGFIGSHNIRNYVRRTRAKEGTATVIRGGDPEDPVLEPQAKRPRTQIKFNNPITDADAKDDESSSKKPKCIDMYHMPQHIDTVLKPVGASDIVTIKMSSDILYARYTYKLGPVHYTFDISKEASEGQ